MRVLVLGASGLIGHTLVRELSRYYEVYGTLHFSKSHYDNIFFRKHSFIFDIDIMNFDIVKGIIYALKPDYIINCVGITKRKIDKQNIEDATFVNACFPHKLVRFAQLNENRVIHFSTDCVFDGKKGNYLEEDLTTAEDIYGRTKALGEIINYNNCLTIRSSFIGQELYSKTELLDWFLSQDGNSIKGFKNTLYSGVSTIFMTKVVRKVIDSFPEISGLYNLAPSIPISKYDLLNLAKDIFDVHVKIIPDYSIIHKPTLDGSKFKEITGIVIPDWREMLEELALFKHHYK